MSEQLRILKMIEDGEISPDEGIKMLKELESTTQPKYNTLGILEQIERGDLSTDEALAILSPSREEAQAQTEDIGETSKEQSSSEPITPPNISEDEMNRWKRWWSYPMYIGIGIVLVAAFWMSSTIQNAGYNFWFYCSWAPLLLGLLLILLSWRSRSGPWLHVRVNGPKDHVAISMPIPLGLSAWGLRTFGHHIPQLEHTSVDEIIMALETTAKSGSPFYVHVDEGEDGEQVEVFIG